MVFSRIEELLNQKTDGPVVIGIDGRCASGKTTLAKAIAKRYDCDIVQADDFYLRKEQRSIARLKEPGGNIDRERMFREIFGPLRSSTELWYQPFDCQNFCLKEKECVHIGRMLIIEGAYCLHPMFEEFYDLKIFVDIDPIPQMIRLIQRNGADMAEVFQCHWIPLEERYLAHYHIQNLCDIVI